MLTIEAVSENLSLSENEVIQRGLRSLLLAELSRSEAEIAHLRERYNLLTADILKQAIAKGTIQAHPAWEDYIVWQNTLETITELSHLLELDYA